MQKVAPEKAPPNSWAARLAGPSSGGGTLTPGLQGASSSRAADPLTTASSGLSGSGQIGPAAHQTSGKVTRGQLLLLCHIWGPAAGGCAQPSACCSLTRLPCELMPLPHRHASRPLPAVALLASGKVCTSLLVL